MFSTLAKYIFGGIMGDAPETTPMQYQTREVNDWLLVDMPDQAIDNEDLDSESDEDDILTALPLLMTQEDNSICDTSYHNHNDTNNDDEKLVKMGNILETHNALQSTFLNECIEDFQVIPESLYLNQSLYYPSDFSLVISQCFDGYHSTTTRYPQKIYIQMQMPKDHKKESVTSKKFRSPSPLSAEKILANIQNPINFVHHRSSALPPKKALLEQIKELKPAQRAIEHNSKKYLKRSQLNRQNRNYIYESSVKTNRRRNLQRNHSGANNNRKC